MANHWRNMLAPAFLAPTLALLSEQRFRRLPRLPAGPADGPWPSLSIIVPARNEAENLRRLLPSLTLLQYEGQLELIVVDDDSTDGTAAVAMGFGARVVRIDDLPAGWLGKPNACHQGALAATGQWLLFTDADTVHQADSLKRAVSFVLTHHLDGLSLFLRQETNSPLDRLALMTAFGGLFAGMKPAPTMLNGQYILVRRQTYLASGGFAAVANQPLEDLALGRRLACQGYRVPILHGDDVGHVRMYPSLGSLWRGLARLSAGSLYWTGPGSLLTVLFITSAAVPLLALPGALFGRVRKGWIIVSWLVVVPGIVPWARRFGSAGWAVLAPVGAVVVQFAAVWGLLSRLFGRRLYWKGRPV